jgi:menaquinone-dependent protoporphyrinogen oxidase
MRILIVYGTTEGHTASLVERMREAIAARGFDVQVARAGNQPVAIPEDVNGVIVGASVHKGKYQAEIHEFVVGNRDRLTMLPSAFFQVCLAAADPSPEAAEQTQALVDAFVQSTGWHPDTVATFAGKLAWSQYDFFTRVLLKLVLRALHRPAEERDTSHDRDYTDYDAVRSFAEAFADGVAARERAHDLSPT